MRLGADHCRGSAVRSRRQTLRTPLLGWLRIVLVPPVEPLPNHSGAQERGVRAQENPVMQQIAVDREAHRGGQLADEQPFGDAGA